MLVRPLVPEGFLEGYTPPLFASAEMPSAIEIDGRDNLDDTLELNLSMLPQNEDGSLMTKTIIYNGGLSGFDTLKLSGGTFKSTVYTMTGPDSGIITMTSDGHENDPLTVIFTGLEPIYDSNDGGGVEIDAYGSNDIVVQDAGQQTDQYGTFDTATVYEANGHLESVTF